MIRSRSIQSLDRRSAHHNPATGPIAPGAPLHVDPGVEQTGTVDRSVRPARLDDNRTIRGPHDLRHRSAVTRLLIVLPCRT